MSIETYLQEALTANKTAQQQRKRVVRHTPTAVQEPRGLVFNSNDYLGLANHPQLRARAQEACQHYGLGSGSSHLIHGHCDIHAELEEELAKFFAYPRCLLFSNGYMANLGVISALLDKKDILLQDKLNHTSLLQGAVLSGARSYRYAHNQASALEKKLHSLPDCRHRLVITDGVFSMDGDYADLPALTTVCRANHCWLMVDDAHGIGVLGPQGKGLLAHFNLGIQQVPIMVGTLSKALGCYGAFVVGSNDFIEYCLQFAKPYGYTSALPPMLAATALSALRLLQQQPERPQKLQNNIRFFQELARDKQLPMLPSDSAIQALLLKDSKLTLAVAHELARAGFLVAAIRAPTVAPMQARLRISLSAEHSYEHIEQLLVHMTACLQTFGVFNVVTS